MNNLKISAAKPVVTMVCTGKGDYSEYFSAASRFADEITFLAYCGENRLSYRQAIKYGLYAYNEGASLPELYSAADACVFPAKNEGVGFPVLEAMACGIPVACASCGALPEVAGDCAVFFDPEKPEEIAAAIGKVVRLQSGVNDRFRKTVTGKALEWVAGYTWARCSAETLQIAVEAALGSL